jgi:hypothetical protein
MRIFSNWTELERKFTSEKPCVVALGHRPIASVTQESHKRDYNKTGNNN